MQFFESWKHSLAMCRLDNIKHMLQATFSSMNEVIHVLTAGWYLLPVAAILTFVTYYAGLSGFIVTSHILIMVSSILVLLAARKTHEVKDSTYFGRSIRRIFILWLLAIVTDVLLWMLSVVTIFKVIIIIALFVLAITPVYIDLFILFDLDSGGSSKSKFNALYMVWYNYPLFVFYTIGTHLVVKCLGIVVEVLLHIMQNMLSEMMILILVGVSTIALHGFLTLFIKCLTVSLYYNRLQDQPELYQ